MNRGLLLSVLSCGLLVAAAGCGDDTTGTGGGGTTTSTTTTGTGSTTTGTTTSTTGTGSTTSTGMTAASCTDYCAAIDTACGTPFGQYVSVDACLAICPAFMQGNPGDTSMNTLECRAYHAGAAASAADPHCYHAGPLGSAPGVDGGCGGQRCSSFCQAALHVCDGNDVVWPTEADCMTDCMQITDDVEFSTDTTAGDSLACRMYHLEVAAEGKQQGMAGVVTQHCPHIALDSSQCGG